VFSISVSRAGANNVPKSQNALFEILLRVRIREDLRFAAFRALFQLHIFIAYYYLSWIRLNCRGTNDRVPMNCVCIPAHLLTSMQNKWGLVFYICKTTGLFQICYLMKSSSGESSGKSNLGAFQPRIQVQKSDLGIEQCGQATVHISTKVLQRENCLCVLDQNIAGCWVWKRQNRNVT